MHPVLHKDRRVARVKYLRKTFQHQSSTVYTDASTGANRNSTAVAVDHQGELIDCITIKALDTDEAATSAVLLAIRWGEHTNKSLNILTDSKRAILNLAAGRIPKHAQKILSPTLNHKHTIIWCPGHEGLDRKEMAYKVARFLRQRAESEHSYSLPPPETHQERLSRFRRRRQNFSSHHTKT